MTVPSNTPVAVDVRSFLGTSPLISHLKITVACRTGKSKTQVVFSWFWVIHSCNMKLKILGPYNEEFFKLP